MRITHQSVARPVFTVMVVLIVVLTGAVSLSRLPIDLMPEMTYPTLTVATSYENASPEEMEELITRPVEEAVAAVPGVEQITSVSSEGSSNVRVTFTWGIDLDGASNDLRDRIDRIMGQLPDDADRPQLRKFDVAQFPILIMGASSRMDPTELRLLIDNQLRHRIEQIPGVAALDVWGGLEREIQVNVDADVLRALGLSLNQVVQAIRDANVNVPAGTIERDQYNVTLRTPGEFTSVQELRATVIAMSDGAPIYLGQVADVRDTHQRQTRIVRINGEPGVRLAVRKQAGTNTVQVAQAVLSEVERIGRDVPQVKLVPIIDTSQYIQRAISNVSRTVLIGGSLAILVLLFFLRNLRSTAVIAVAIPISIIATFGLVYFSGFTLNLMTLGGLALGVGMMVDSAIVVLENIYRHREKGEEPHLAAVRGTEQVSAAITAGTITTLIIFLPMVFFEGISGVMFRQLAYVVGFSLICSLLVALTLVPMLAARLLGPVTGQRPIAKASAARRAFAASGRMFDALEEGYKNLLGVVLRHRFITLVLVLMTFGGSLLLIPLIGSEFMPAADEGEVRITAEMEVGTRLELVDRQIRRIEQIVRDEVPEIENMVVNVGSSGWRGGGGSTGDLRLSLVAASQRTRTSEQIAEALRPALAGIPGTVVRTRAGQGLFLLNMGAGGDNLEIQVRGWELATLDALAQEIAARLDDVPGITDVRLTREAGVQQELLRPDRARAADLGLTPTQIARTLETAIAGTSAGEYREGGNEYRILVKLADAEQMDLDDILDITLINDQNEQVMLRNVIDPQTGRGPTQIDRKDQQRVATVTAGTSGRDLGSIVADLRERLADIAVPRDYEISIAGDYEEQQEAFGELLLALLLSLTLVYMVMACLYESLRDPLVVMFAVPMAAIGVLLTLLITNTTLNVQSFIGCIMLGGIVVNNAILIVDQASQLRRDQGMAPRDAVREAGRLRLRPILMTSFTTGLGLTPLALGWGEGADAQAPMARAVVGGLISSTLITLVLIPVVYTLFHREKASA